MTCKYLLSCLCLFVGFKAAFGQYYTISSVAVIDNFTDIPVFGSTDALAINCTVNLTCLSECPNDILTIAWFLEGQTIDNSTFVVSNASPYTVDSIGTVVSTLTTKGPVSLSHAGLYTCNVSLDTGHSDSHTHVVIVRVPGVIDISVASNTNVTAGMSHLFVCSALPQAGLQQGDLTYRWTNPSGSSVSANSNYTISSVSVTDAGTYTCTVSASYSNPFVDIQNPTNSEASILTVKLPTPGVSARGNTAVAGISTNLSCTVTLISFNSYSTNTQIELTWVNILTYNTLATKTTHLFNTFINPRTNTAGLHTCSVRLLYTGTASPVINSSTNSSNTLLFVQIPKPEISLASLIVMEGMPAVFTCAIEIPFVVSGSDYSGLSVVSPSIIPSGDGNITQGPDILYGYTSYITFQYTIYNIDFTNAGVYTCTASLGHSNNSYILTSPVSSGNGTLYTIGISVNPVTQTVLPVQPYDTFTVNCTVTITPTPTNYSIVFHWPQLEDISFLRFLSTTEGNSNTISGALESTQSLTCVANVSVISEDNTGTLIMSEPTVINVKGQSLPVQPLIDGVLVISNESVIIFWTIPEVAFTPENYTVHYGLASDALLLSSITISTTGIETAEFLVATNVQYNVTITELNNDVVYYFQIVSQNVAGHNYSDIRTFSIISEESLLSTSTVLNPTPSVSSSLPSSPPLPSPSSSLLSSFSLQSSSHLSPSPVLSPSPTQTLIPEVPLLLEHHFENTTVNQSSILQLSCSFTGQPLPNVIWFHNNQILQSFSENAVITTFSNLSTVVSRLAINNVKKSDDGYYTCIGTNENEIIRHSAFITVQVPATVQSITSSTINSIVNASVTIAYTIADAFPAVRSSNIHWFLKRKDADIFSPIDSSFLSDDWLNFTKHMVQLNDRGLYKLSVTNEAGTSEAMTTLDVFVPAVLLNKTGGTEVKRTRQNVSFNCTADGIPQPSIVWRKDGQLITTTTRRRISLIRGSDGLRDVPGILQTTSTLTITGLRVSDSGSYSCRADNEANIGDILRVPFTLQVIDIQPIDYCQSSPCQNNGKCRTLTESYLCECMEGYTGTNCQDEVIISIPPQIIIPPQSTTVKLYYSASLTCVAIGSPNPSILWYKDNVLIANSNENPAVFHFNEINLNDRGFYHCEAKNIINGNNESIISSKALLNITNVVQYEAEIQLLNDTNNGTYMSEEEILLDKIEIANNYLVGSNISTSSSILSLTVAEFFDSPIVIVSLITEGEHEAEQLKQRVTDQLNEYFLVFASRVLEVERFDGCPSASTTIPSHSGNDDLDITIAWPETSIGVWAVVDCPCGNGTSGGGKLQVSRYCGGNFTRGGYWQIPDVSPCNFSDLAREICLLSNLPVAEKVEQLNTLTSDAANFGSNEVAASVSVLVTATDRVSGNFSLTDTFLEVVANILDIDENTLQESQETSNTSSRVLEAIERVVEDIPIMNSSEAVVIAQRSFAVSVQQVNIEQFGQFGQAFSVDLRNTSNLTANSLSFGVTTSSPTGLISLPNNLFSTIPHNINTTRITNAIFVSDSLFLRRNKNYLEVGSIVISATVVGAGPIRGLTSPVGLQFQVIPVDGFNGSSPQCKFWNQSLDSGYGDWSNEGCTTNFSNDTLVICSCNHLTSFAVLLDVSPTIEPTDRTGLTLFLDSVSYIGIIVSLICLMITVISYLANKKLRSSDHGQLLLNLCFALMGLYISFIVALHSRYVDAVCALAAAALQYFFLVTFAIMAAEAVNLYMNLVIVIGRKIRHFVLKSTVLSWVAPFFIVLFCIAPNYENYLNKHFCRAFNAPFYIGMVVPFLAIYIFNWIVFVIIIVSLIQKVFLSKLRDSKAKKEDRSLSFLKQLIIAVTLSVMFGLGWGIGLLATEEIYSDKTVRDVFAILFVIATAFHGFFIFVMHCLRSKDVRRTWRSWFFCGSQKNFTNFSSSVASYKVDHKLNTLHPNSPTFDRSSTFGAEKSDIKLNLYSFGPDAKAFVFENSNAV